MSIFSLGFVGLGSIGLPIARNLVQAGFDLKVHTRSRHAENDKDLKKSKSCDSPEKAAQGCQVLFICVSDDEAVQNVLFGPGGAYASLGKGAIVVDLSTISPATARNISRKLEQKHVQYCDAPVSGGTEGAQNGTLTMFMGCDKTTLHLLSPVLQRIAKYYYSFGGVGKGQEVKAINQILVAGNYIALAEAIAMGQALELSMDDVIQALQGGAGSSWALANRSTSMLHDRYPLGFKLKLHHKDLSIALQTAEALGLNLSITKKVRDIEENLISKGFGDKDVAVLRRSIIGSQ